MTDSSRQMLMQRGERVDQSEKESARYEFRRAVESRFEGSSSGIRKPFSTDLKRPATDWRQ